MSNFLTTFLIITTTIVVISFFSCIVPISQYLYFHFIKKDKCSIKYYFSEYLFDNHMQYDVGLNDARVINNSHELEKLWKIEMSHDLP